MLYQYEFIIDDNKMPKHFSVRVKSIKKNQQVTEKIRLETKKAEVVEVSSYKTQKY